MVQWGLFVGLMVLALLGALPAGWLWWPSLFHWRMVQLLKFRSERLSSFPQHWCMCDILLMALHVAVWMLWRMELFPAFTAIGVSLMSSAFRAMLFAVPVCDIHRLPHQPSCCREREFVRVNAAFPDGSSTSPRCIYLRTQAVQQWQALNKFEHVLHIEGPPGTGKSTIVWAWACHKAAFKNVVWVQCDCSGGARICLLVAGYAVCCAPIHSDQKSRIREQMAFYARMLKADIVVVDGITGLHQQGLFGDAAKWANKHHSRRAVLVSSAQFRLQGEFFTTHRIIRFSMPSWTWEQYVAACNGAEFFKGVREKLGWTHGHHDEDITPACKLQLMQDKYYFAGTSARWMFATTVDAVIEEIWDNIRAVSDQKGYANGLVGDRSTQARNHLCGVDEWGKMFFVSKAVMRAFVEIADNEITAIANATSLAELYAHGAFSGWVFEFDFLLRVRFACEDKIRANKQITVTTQTGLQEQWAAVRHVPFFNATDFDGKDDINFSPGTWYIPRKVNQGGFDAVVVTSRSSLRFVQVTVGKTHSCKLQYLRTFGLAWEKYARRKLNKVEFVAVVPPSASFKWDAAVSNVPSAWNLALRKVSFARARLN